MAKNDNVSRETYNGWKNYETWLVKLWIDNDREMLVYIYDSIEDMDVYGASNWIEDLIEESIPEFGGAIGGLFDDLIYASMGRVDWYEIAEVFKDEVEGV